MWRQCLVLLLVLMGMATASTAHDDLPSIPWGAMYIPIDQLIQGPMTGTIAAYRGERGATQWLIDLAAAQAAGRSIIATLGSVTPSRVLDSEGHLDMAAVRRELAPFLEVADAVRPYVGDRTLWGIRFLDEPHDPSGYPADFEVDPLELAEAFRVLGEAFPDVPCGSTAPPQYMARVPGAGLSFGQIVHAKLPQGFAGPIDFHRRQSEEAHAHGLLYVASLNANTNSIDDLTFFETYRQMCSLPRVDFVTAWQWPQGHHPMPSFEARFANPTIEVQAIIDRIPEACLRR